MEQKDGLEVAVGPRELFALGALAPLGPYPQVHLAPKIPPALLNTALMAYLSLQNDEHLLAVIEGSGGKLAGSCAGSRLVASTGPRSTTATKARGRLSVALPFEHAGNRCAATCSITSAPAGDS